MKKMKKKTKQNRETMEQAKRGFVSRTWLCVVRATQI
jgi:hypothetical protein